MKAFTEQYPEIASKYYKDLTFYRGAESYAADSEEIKIFASVKEYYEVQVMKIITCAPEDVEKLYNEMIQTIDSMGQDKLNEQIDDFFQNKNQKIAQYSADLK